MSTLVLILDAQPDYLSGSGLTLLQTPVGAGSLLEHLMEGVGELGDAEVTVLHDANADDRAYREFVLQATGPVDSQVVDTVGLTECLTQREPSDWVLIVDPVVHALSELPLRWFVDEARRGRQVTHLLAAAPSSPVANDRLLLDGQGQVRRIQRYYAGTTQVQRHGVICSMLPATVLHAVDEGPVGDLPELRQTLVRQGLPSRDLSLSDGVIDLTTEAGLLQCMEWHVSGAAADHQGNGGNGKRHGRGRSRSGTARKGRVEPGASTYGPVVVERDAVVEAGAIIIGPAVVGAGAHVSAGSVVVHGLIAPGVIVPPGQVVRRRLVLAVEPKDGHALQDTASIDGDSWGGWRVDYAAETDVAARGAWRYPAVKRVLETILASAGLLALAPLLVIVALLVKLTSRGPVFFAHHREGLGGREFRCWKFRTMVSNAHALQRKLYAKNQVDGPQFKMDYDPRITRVGNWLRKSNLDELPQLFNVVLGQMSLIGPRPSPFRENQICVPWRQARLSVRPGITGLWQVCRHERAAGDFHQWIHYDMLYVRHMSALLDAKIVLFTFLTLAGRWSVPLRWLIREEPLTAGASDAGPAGIPILEEVETVAPRVDSVRSAL